MYPTNMRTQERAIAHSNRTPFLSKIGRLNKNKNDGRIAQKIFMERSATFPVSLVSE